MTADRTVDEHLRAAYDALVVAIYHTKQGAWAAGSAERRGALRDLLSFFIEQSHRVDEAEAAIDGRSPQMSAPSSHERQNLLGEARNDLDAARAAYVAHITDLAADLDRRASAIGDGVAAELLADIADQLKTRIADLERVD